MVNFNFNGLYQIIIDGNYIDPIDSLFPHDFQYKVNDGEWTSGPANYVTGGSAPSDTASVIGGGQTDDFCNPENDDYTEDCIIYFRIDLTGNGYDYVESGNTGIVVPVGIDSSVDVGILYFNYDVPEPTCEESGGVEIWGECYNIDETDDFTDNPPEDGMEIPVDETGYSPICDLINVEEIELSGYNLVGTIPECFGEMPNLQYLNLEENQLTGTIPESFGNKDNWEEINLENNLLDGVISDSICNILDLYDLESASGLLQEGDFKIEDNNFCPEDFPWCFTSDYSVTSTRNGNGAPPSSRLECGNFDSVEDDCGFYVCCTDNPCTNADEGCFWSNGGPGPSTAGDWDHSCIECIDPIGNNTGLYRCEYENIYLGDNEWEVVLSDQCETSGYTPPNWMSQLVEDQTCTYGCMDDTACNYDPDATEDNGSCTYDLGCSCDYFGIEPEEIQCWDGNFEEVIPPVQACPAENCATFGYSDTPPIGGCMDGAACNYDASAQVDDGSCWYPGVGNDYCDCEYNVIDTCGNCGGGCFLPSGPYDGCVECEDGSYACSEYGAGGDSECPEVSGVTLWGVFYSEFTTTITSGDIGPNGVDICDPGSGMAYGQIIPPEICQLISVDEIELSDCGLTGTIPECLAEMPVLERLELNQNQLTGGIPQSFALKGDSNDTTEWDYIVLTENLLSEPISELFCNLLYLGEEYNDGGYLNPVDFELEDNKFCPADFPWCFFGTNNPEPPRNGGGRDECQAGQVEDDCGQCVILNQSDGEETNLGCWWYTGPAGTGTAPTAGSYSDENYCHQCVDSSGESTGHYRCDGNEDDCPIPDYEVPDQMLNIYEDQDCVLGCTDSSACNYIEDAYLYGEEDGSCWWVTGGGDCDCTNGEGAIADCSGGCYNPTLGESPAHTVDCNGVCSDDIDWIGDQGNNGIDLCGLCGGIIYLESDCFTNQGEECCGCIDGEALNYDSAAAFDDGTCEYVYFWGTEWGISTTHIDLEDVGYLTGEQIPEEICQLINLESINIANNGLTGYVPECLWSLQKLYSLQVDNNYLTGMLPENIGTFGAFGSGVFIWQDNPFEDSNVHLQLENNEFYGGFPDSICNIYDNFGPWISNDFYWKTRFEFDNNNLCETYYVNQTEVSGWPDCLTDLQIANNVCIDCMDEFACNYNPTALGVNNDSCVYNYTCPNGTEVCNVQDCNQFVGCTDSYASNYDSYVTEACNGNNGDILGNDECLVDIGTDNCCCTYTTCPQGEINLFEFCIPENVDEYSVGIGILNFTDFGDDITGPIPDRIQDFYNVSAIYMGGNMITGPLPSYWPSAPLGDDELEYGDQYLQDLVLNDNQIGGIIPSEIFEISRLYQLKFYNNKLGQSGAGGAVDSGGYGSGYSLVNETYDICSSPFIQDLILSPNSDRLSLENNYICPPYPSCIQGPDYGLNTDDQNLQYCVSINTLDWGCKDTGNLTGDDLTIWNLTYDFDYPNNGIQAYNYDSNALYEDGSCIYLSGCTDTEACNYDSTFQIDDGSCEYPITDDLGTDCTCDNTYPYGYNCGYYVPGPQPDGSLLVCEPAECPNPTCVAEDLPIFGQDIPFTIDNFDNYLDVGLNGQIPPQIACFSNLESINLHGQSNIYDYDPTYDGYNGSPGFIPGGTAPYFYGFQTLPPEEQWVQPGISGVLIPQIGQLTTSLTSIDFSPKWSEDCGGVSDCATSPCTPDDGGGHCAAPFPLSPIPTGMFDNIVNLEYLNLSNTGVMGEIPIGICNTNLFGEELQNELDESYYDSQGPSTADSSNVLRNRAGFRNGYLLGAYHDENSNPAIDGKDIYFASGPGSYGTPWDGTTWDWTDEEGLAEDTPYPFGYASDMSPALGNPQFHWSWGNKLCPLGPTVKLPLQDFDLPFIDDLVEDWYEDGYLPDEGVWDCGVVCAATPMTDDQIQYLESVGESIDNYESYAIYDHKNGDLTDDVIGQVYISSHRPPPQVSYPYTPWDERELICECGVYPSCIHNIIRNSYSRKGQATTGESPFNNWFRKKNPAFSLMGIQSGFLMESDFFEYHTNYKQWYSFCQGGCTNPDACNYIPPAGYEPENDGWTYTFDATFYDGSVQFPAWHPFKPGNFISYDDGSCQLPEQNQKFCYAFDEDPAVCNTSPNKFWSSRLVLQDWCEEPECPASHPSESEEDGERIYGCMDPGGINYYFEANCDPEWMINNETEGTSTYCDYYDDVGDFGVPGVEIKQSFFDPYDAFSGLDVFYPQQGVTTGDVFGCTDENAFNYNPLATIDYNCIYRPEGIVEYKMVNFNGNLIYECRTGLNSMNNNSYNCDDYDHTSGGSPVTCFTDGVQYLQSVEECCLLIFNDSWIEDYDCLDVPLYTGDSPNQNFAEDLQNITVIPCDQPNQYEGTYQCWKTENLPPESRDIPDPESPLPNQPPEDYPEIFQNTIEGWENSNSDGRPSLGCFYFDDNNESSDNFNLLTNAEFVNYTKSNLVDNPDGFFAAKEIRGDVNDYPLQTFPDPYGTGDYWLVYYPGGGWQHSMLRGTIWNDWSYDWQGNQDHHNDQGQNFEYYDWFVSDPLGLDEPSPLTQTDNALMWAGGIPHIYPYRINTTNDYNLHTYAEWVIDTECYSYQKCLIFETNRPLNHPYNDIPAATIEDCLAVTGENNCQQTENYSTLNQAQTLLTSDEATQLLRPYSSMKVSFWMKTARKDTIIQEVTGQESGTPQVEIGLVPVQATEQGDVYDIGVQSEGECGGCTASCVMNIGGQEFGHVSLTYYGSCDEAQDDGIGYFDSVEDFEGYIDNQSWQIPGYYSGCDETIIQNCGSNVGLEDGYSSWPSVDGYTINCQGFECACQSGTWSGDEGDDSCGSFNDVTETDVFRFGTKSCPSLPGQISDWFYFQPGEHGEWLCDNTTIVDIFSDIGFEEHEICPDTLSTQLVCQRLGNDFYYEPSGHYNSEIAQNNTFATNLSPRGAVGKFQNSNIDEWEKFEFTFNLSDDFKNVDDTMKQISLLVQWGNYSAGRIYLDNFEVTEAGDFLPDVDVRAKNSYGEYGVGRLTEYYDPDLQPEEYESTLAPLEAQFYFYPRYPYNEVFYTDRPIMYTAFRQNEFYLYDVDWGDGSPPEFIEPNLINENTAVYHTYENSGIYEVTGYMLRTKIDEGGNSIGVIHNQRFNIRININQGSDEDFPYFGTDGFSFIPYKNTVPIVGGVSKQSSYYKNIERQLGFLGESEEGEYLKVNVPFAKISDKFKTEAALLKIDSTYELDLEILPYFMEPRYSSSTDQTDENLINYGLNPIKEELGKSIGDTDITNVRWFNEPKQIWEMLGFPQGRKCERIEFSLNESFDGDGEYYSPDNYFFYISDNSEIEFEGYINPMSSYDCNFDFSNQDVYLESLNPITNIRAICNDGTEVEIVNNLSLSDLDYPNDCFDCYQLGVAENICLDEGSQYGCGFSYQSFPPCYCEDDALGCCNEIDAVWNYSSGIEACGESSSYFTNIDNPGNPISPRYWKNIIPDYYTVEEHISIPESFDTRRQTSGRSMSNVDMKKLQGEIMKQSSENLRNDGYGETHEPTGWNYIQTTLQTFVMFFVDTSLYPDMLDFIPTAGDAVGFFYTKTDGIDEPQEVNVGWDVITENNLPGTDQPGGPYFMLAMVLDDGSDYSTRYPNVGASWYELGQLQGGYFKYYNSATGQIGKLINTSLCNYYDELTFFNNQIDIPGCGGITGGCTPPSGWTVDYSDETMNATMDEICENYFESGTTMTVDIPTWGATLVSFPLTMENNEPEDIFGLDGDIYSIITEEFAATLMDGVGWVGSLTEIDPLKGYWVYNSDEGGTTVDIEGESVGNPTYELNPGIQPSLISYPFLHSQDVGCTLDGLEDIITVVIGDGVAVIYDPDIGWTGSIESFEPGTGYWVKHKSGATTEFNWNQCSTTSSTPINEFNFRFPKNWHEISINDIIEEIESQTPTIKKILINRILKKQRGYIDGNK